MNFDIIFVVKRGVAQFGRALRSGRRGRGFESRRLDSVLEALKIRLNSGFSVLFAFYIEW